MAGQEDWWTTIVAEQTAFFLDVDGTLLGFKDRAEDVVADRELLDLLSRLDVASQGAIALVSGRMIADLDRIVAPLVLAAGGVHGSDLRFTDGRREAAEGAALAAVRDHAQAFVAAHEGLRLEDKGSAIAIHYRQKPDLADDVRLFLKNAVDGHDLEIQHGKMVAEVKSGRGHKGMAIDALMETSPFVGRVPLFMGDDLTDEHGFETVNRRGGISIKIGEESEATIAHFRLADTSVVRHFLDVICRSAEHALHDHIV